MCIVHLVDGHARFPANGRLGRGSRETASPLPRGFPKSARCETIPDTTSLGSESAAENVPRMYVTCRTVEA